MKKGLNRKKTLKSIPFEMERLVSKDANQITSLNHIPFTAEEKL